MHPLAFILFLIHQPAGADLDKYQSEGVQQTKQMLTNPDERQKVIDRDPKAKDMDKKVELLGGSQKNKNDMYGLAAGIFDKIAAEAGGDPDKMQKLLDEAQKNPEAFYNKYFDADQKAQVRGIAGSSSSGNNAPAVKPGR